MERGLHIAAELVLGLEECVSFKQKKKIVERMKETKHMSSLPFFIIIIEGTLKLARIETRILWKHMNGNLGLWNK